MNKVKESTAKLELEKGSLKENMREAAYYNWLNRGCPPNDELCDWVKMENDLVGKFE
jgi:hypothetical protein